MVLASVRVMSVKSSHSEEPPPVPLPPAGMFTVSGAEPSYVPVAAPVNVNALGFGNAPGISSASFAANSASVPVYPIPYSGNMALTSGLYYIQDYTIYLCTRDTGNPVYNPLAELVGIYVNNI